MKRTPYLSILHTALAALLIATAAACSDDDPSDAPVPGTDGTSPDATNLVTVRFSSGDDATPETRTTIDTDGEIVKWTTGDKIGISAVPTDASGTKVENKLYNPTTSAANSAFKPNDGAEMQLDAGGTYTFTSYYPHWYNATADQVTRFTLSDMEQTNGTSSAHIGEKDFMWAQKTGIEISGTESPQVSFNYKHIFPMLVFSLDNAGAKKVKCISVRSADGTTPVRGAVDVSLADGTTGEVQDGKYYTSLTFTWPMAENGTGRLLILPQAAGATLIVGVLTTDNVLYEYTKTAANALEGGKSYGFTFDLKDGNVDGRTVYAPASVDSEGRWQIADESGLRGFALAVNYYGQSSLNATLTADVTLSAYAAWEDPIGMNDASYSGTFNGGGHTVSGLAIDRTSGDNVGLFGNLSKATVQNLRVTGNVTAGASDYVGGIAGRAYNSSVIKNCFFAGDVTGSSNVGGIAGYNYGCGITACFSSGSVTAKSNYVGGIVGINSGSSASITHSYSSAAVTAEGRVAGGIVGQNSSGGKVTSCYATGTVSAKTNNAGGIAGENNGSTLEKCLALGSAVTRTGTGSSTSFGRVAGYNNATIINCAAWNGMTLPANITVTDNGDGKDGASLTTAACKEKATYTATRGFDATVWSFDGDTFTTYLPWNKAFENFSGIKDADYRIAIPTHLAPVIP